MWLRRIAHYSGADMSQAARTQKMLEAPKISDARGWLSSRALARVMWWAVLLTLLLLAWLTGLSLRSFAFDYLEPIRYRGDLENAYSHGVNVIEHARQSEGLDRSATPGWFATLKACLEYYDLVRAGEVRGTRAYNLDYPPLRLISMTIWTRSIYIPQTAIAVGDLPACAPMLRMNTLFAMLGSAGAFLLVKHWVARGRPPGSNRPTICRWRCRLNPS